MLLHVKASDYQGLVSFKLVLLNLAQSSESASHPSAACSTAGCGHLSWVFDQHIILVMPPSVPLPPTHPSTLHEPKHLFINMPSPFPPILHTHPPTNTDTNIQTPSHPPLPHAPTPTPLLLVMPNDNKHNGTHKSTKGQNTKTHTHTHTHTNTHKHKHKHKHKQTNTHTHANTHTHKHSQTIINTHRPDELNIASSLAKTKGPNIGPFGACHLVWKEVARARPYSSGLFDSLPGVFDFGIHVWPWCIWSWYVSALSRCIYTSIYIYETCICIHIDVHIYIDIDLYMNIYIYVYMHVHIYIGIYL